jgi:hypothetical protein
VSCRRLVAKTGVAARRFRRGAATSNVEFSQHLPEEASWGTGREVSGRGEGQMGKWRVQKGTT